MHVATRGLLARPPSVDQRVDLVQVSADSRGLLDMQRQRATEKLTGMQANYFGAFYKASWRANDWMWGRIDATGWLPQCLLDPRGCVSPDRVKQTFEAIGWQRPRQDDGLQPDEVDAPRGQLNGGLAFLGLDADIKKVESSTDLPASMPVSAMVLARSRQHQSVS